MNNKEQKWIDETMNSLDGIHRPVADVDMYNKVMQRIRSVQHGREIEMISTGAVLRIAAGFFLVVSLNVSTYILYSGSSVKTGDENLKAFAKEYVMSDNNYNY